MIIDDVWVELLDPFPNCYTAPPFFKWIALEVLLRLKPRKYKYNAYSMISSDVLSCSIILIEYETKFVAKALSLS